MISYAPGPDAGGANDTVFKSVTINGSVYWTPMRFPGQYYDAESNLLENWNRY